MFSPFYLLILLAAYLACLAHACPDTAGTIVSYFDAGCSYKNVNGSSLVIDESSNYAFVVTC